MKIYAFPLFILLTKSMLHEKNLIYCIILFVRIGDVRAKQDGYRQGNEC